MGADGQTKSHVLVAAGLIRRGDAVLLVQQQGPDDEAPYWALPGGVLEPGELATEGLAREVREETGLHVLEFGRLAYVCQVVDEVAGLTSTAFALDVVGSEREPQPADPDGYVLRCGFLPREEAAAMLAASPHLQMAEPARAYLRGEAEPGALWLYRRGADGTLHRP